MYVQEQNHLKPNSRPAGQSSVALDKQLMAEVMIGWLGPPGLTC